jgi:hypothetical protein
MRRKIEFLHHSLVDEVDLCSIVEQCSELNLTAIWRREAGLDDNAALLASRVGPQSQ